MESQTELLASILRIIPPVTDFARWLFKKWLEKRKKKKKMDPKPLLLAVIFSGLHLLIVMIVIRDVIKHLLQ